jgi:H+/gluconate symporter-like permease
MSAILVVTNQLIVTGSINPLWVAVILMSPVLAIFFIYGVVLFFKKEKEQPDFLTNNISEELGKKSYKHGLIMLVIGLVLSLLAFMTIQNVRQSAGYSGSEGEIAAFPFIISSAVFLLIATINLLLIFARNLAVKKGSSSIIGKKIF